MCFSSLILDAFHRVPFSVGLIGSSTCWNESFGLPEGAHNRGLPSNPTIYTTSPLDEDWPLMRLVVVHFACPMISSIPPKHQSDEHNQAGANDFQHLIWIF